jgi:hypothetical protein
MRKPIRQARALGRIPTAQLVRHPVVTARRVARSDVPVPTRERAPSPAPPSIAAEFAPNPYADYGRFLTEEGGILIAYKDLDLRLRHTLWRIFAWTIFTGIEGWYLLHHSPVHAVWINVACLLTIAVVNGLIVRKPVELYRTLEIRPDCIILESRDVFWRRLMEVAWPAFERDAEGNQVLRGIYGTRFVEFLTVRRFDELDRAPEVFAAHLQDAIRQLWMNPY